MRKAKDNAQFQAPLMSAFREAFEARDAKDNRVRIVDGERVIEGRHSRQRRSDEPALKRDLSIDLVALLNTINLNSAISLNDLNYVREFDPQLRTAGHNPSHQRGSRRQRHPRPVDPRAHTYEPRIISESIHVDKEVKTNEVDQRVQFTVSCEMFCMPVDIALSFVAELEISSGKVNLTRLPT